LCITTTTTTTTATTGRKLIAYSTPTTAAAGIFVNPIDVGTAHEEKIRRLVFGLHAINIVCYKYNKFYRKYSDIIV